MGKYNITSIAPDYLAMSLEDAPPAFWELLFPLPYQKDLVRDARQRLRHVPGVAAVATTSSLPLEPHADDAVLDPADLRRAAAQQLRGLSCGDPGGLAQPPQLRADPA